jgi:hypothetical protein
MALAEHHPAPVRTAEAGGIEAAYLGLLRDILENGVRTEPGWARVRCSAVRSAAIWLTAFRC